jgi:HEAT repeat protein
MLPVAAEDASVVGQSAVAERFSTMFDKPDLIALQKALREGDLCAKLEAIDALTRRSENFDQILPDLLRALNDINPFIRRSLVQVLGAHVEFSKIIAPVLVKVLRDQDTEVQRQAIRGLGRMQIDDPYVIAGLGSIVRKFKDGIGSDAVLALSAIGGKNAINCLVDALQSGNWETINGLCAIGAPSESSVRKTLYNSRLKTDVV